MSQAAAEALGGGLQPARGFSPALLLLLAAIPLSAQFRNLATDDAGNRAWLSSKSRLRQAGDQHLRSKLFVADAAGRVARFAQRPTDNPYHLLTHPEVSGDGIVAAYRAAYYCHPGTTCRVTISSYGVIGESEFPGRVHLSRNARYVYRHSYDYFGPSDQVELIDHMSGARRTIPVAGFQPIEGGRQVTSDGTVLVYANGTLWLIRRDGSYQYVPSFGLEDPPVSTPFFSPVLRATMNDAGTVVVYQTRSSETPRIHISQPGDPESPRELVATEQGCTDPVISADGSRVLFLSRANFSGNNAAGTAQAWTIETATGRIRQVTSDPAGIEEATLSGDGGIAWVATFAGRLLQVDIETGAIREIVAQTTVVDQDPFGFPLIAASGGLARLTGRGLARQYAGSSLPLATELAGVRLLAGGAPLPLLWVSPFEIRFQVPWEMEGIRNLSLAPARSPFEEQTNRQLRIETGLPEFERLPNGRPVIAHGDFNGLVTEEDPARPGEVLHFYLTGLGRVVPPVETGEPAPAAPLSLVAERLFVFWAGTLPPNLAHPQVLFAGLAPGMVGIYQVSLAVPDNFPFPELGLSVQVGNRGTFATFPVRWR